MAGNLLADFLDIQGRMTRTDQAIALQPRAFLGSLLFLVEETTTILLDQNRNLDDQKKAAELLCKSVRIFRATVNELFPKRPSIKLNIKLLLNKGTQFLNKTNDQTLLSFTRELESTNLLGRMQRCSRRFDLFSAELSSFLPNGILLPGPARLRARVGFLNVRLATVSSQLVKKSRDFRIQSEDMTRKTREVAALQDEIVILRQQLSGAPFVPPTSPVVAKCSCGSEIKKLESLYKKADERCRILEEQKEFLENDLRELGNKLEESEHIVRVQTKQCIDACENEWNALIKSEALQENVAQLEGELRQANERLAGLARREVIEPTTLFRDRDTDAETYVSDLFDGIAAEEVAQDAGAAPTQSRKRKGDSPTDNDAEFGSRAQKSKKKKAKVDEEYEEEMSGLELPHQLDMYIGGGGANLDDMDSFEQRPMGDEPDEQQSGLEKLAEMDMMAEAFMAQKHVVQADAVLTACQSDPVQTVVLAEEAQNQQQVEREGDAAAASGQTDMELVAEQNPGNQMGAACSDPIQRDVDRDMRDVLGLDTPKEVDTSDTPRNFIEELFGAGGIAESAGRTVAAEAGQRPVVRANAVDIEKRRQLSITPPRPEDKVNTEPQTALPTVPADVPVPRVGDVKAQATETDGEGKSSSQGSSSSNGTSSGGYYSCRSSQSVEEKDLSSEGDAMIEESQVVDGTGINGNEGDDETLGLEKEGEKIADGGAEAVKVVSDTVEEEQMETREENAGQDVMHPGPGGSADRDPAVSGDEHEEMDTSESSTAPKRSSWLNPFSWFRRSGSQ